MGHQDQSNYLLMCECGGERPPGKRECGECHRINMLRDSHGESLYFEPVPPTIPQPFTKERNRIFRVSCVMCGRDQTLPLRVVLTRTIHCGICGGWCYSEDSVDFDREPLKDRDRVAQSQVRVIMMRVGRRTAGREGYTQRYRLKPIPVGFRFVA